MDSSKASLRMVTASRQAPGPRRYRTIQIQAGRQTITAVDPLPDDLRQALNVITRTGQGRTNLCECITGLRPNPTRHAHAGGVCAQVG